MMTTKVETYPMMIGGQSVAGSSGKFVEVFNPSTEELIGRVPVASPEEIDLAVKTAYDAFKVWRDTPAAERAAMKMKFIQTVRNNIDEIARILTMEHGKPLWQVRG
jgi:acyl-CoA reductase-like NAD-dependent aldehyde dehydrogenase